MASSHVLSPRPVHHMPSYTRKRRQSFSAPPPNLLLPFPQAPRPVSPLLTPSAVTAVAARKRAGYNPPLEATKSRTPSTLPDRRRAIYGDQGISLATPNVEPIAATCTKTTLVLVDDGSHPRKKPRSSSQEPNSTFVGKFTLWNMHTYPFNKMKNGLDSGSKRLPIPSFGWTKATSNLSESTDPDHVLVASLPPNSQTESAHIRVSSVDLGTIDECEADEGGDVTMTDQLPLNKQNRISQAHTSESEKAEIQLRSNRRKSPSPPPPPPRFSSPLGPARHILPPRPRFPRPPRGEILRLGPNGVRKSLGQTGAGADMYRRVLLKNAHIVTRRRLEEDRSKSMKSKVEHVVNLSSHDDDEEVYVLRLSEEDVKAVLIAAEKVQEQVNMRVDEQRSAESEPRSGYTDLSSLPDIPDMDLEDPR